MNLWRTHFFSWTRLVFGLAAGATLVIILGCQSFTPAANVEGTSPVLTVTTTPPGRIPTVERGPTQNPVTVVATEEPEDEVITLTLWTIEEISPEAEGEPGDFIRDSLRAFREANPDIKVDLFLKKASGKGGMLDFLRTARDVAPTILPDVAILDVTDLIQAHADGLIQPLDGRLDRSIVQDLLPAARRMGTINDELVGVPLGIEMEHTVYNMLAFESPPLLWTDVLTADTKYLFPAKGTNGLVNDLTLAQYLSTGGRLVDEEGIPTIDEAALRSVLDFYEQAVENGTIEQTILETATTEELWPNYLEGLAGIAQITVRQYLIDRELLSNTLFTPLPVQSAENLPVLITHGRALVLITNNEDLQRQAAALRLIEWFLSMDNNATWNQINKSIPTRDTAYQQLAGDDPYWIFLTEQLNRAQPQPSFAGYDRLGRILQQAVVQVISGEATPEEATATAIDALTP